MNLAGASEALPYLLTVLLGRSTALSSTVRALGGRSLVLLVETHDAVTARPSLPYIVLVTSGESDVLPYATLVTRTRSLVAPYTVSAPVGASPVLPFATRALASLSARQPYAVLHLASRGLVLPAALAQLAGRSAALLWSTTARLATELELPYVLLEWFYPVRNTLALPYAVTELCGQTVLLAYLVHLDLTGELIVMAFSNESYVEPPRDTAVAPVTDSTVDLAQALESVVVGDARLPVP
jgi:hypothetical protein